MRGKGRAPTGAGCAFSFQVNMPDYGPAICTLFGVILYVIGMWRLAESRHSPE